MSWQKRGTIVDAKIALMSVVKKTFWFHDNLTILARDLSTKHIVSKQIASEDLHVRLIVLELP